MGQLVDVRMLMSSGGMSGDGKNRCVDADGGVDVAKGTS